MCELLQLLNSATYGRRTRRTSSRAAFCHGSGVSKPLYQAKAELFRTLGHPVRIRVLELLQDGPLPVRDLLAEIDVEASNLSQQLSVLRRAGMVTSTREGSLVVYALSTPDAAALLAVGRRLLGAVLTDRDELLVQLLGGVAAPTGELVGRSHATSSVRR